ncbi:TonB-dependent receptor [Sulfurovum sp. AR]|uniref:TonB-dependent receptor n=1 Tax=Sulfurovum sp. AR TaxID=1165841 RepID=UPI00025C4FA0|nr:TonB-dependent receptor [Sulfurovum sp. AR]EIF51207.1 TonB-dependent receptor [Sulfurovum sp. AR]
MTFKSLSLITATLLLTSNTYAGETLEPLIITSTGIETNELQAADAIEVYTTQDIEQAHVQNVYEFLNKATSVFTTNAYGNPFMQKIDMRGFGVGDGYQNIVVTINGRKMNNVDMVPQLLSSISPSSIEKIEIIKSSGIVLGGDGANAGAINIITKQSNDKELTFYAGTYGLIDGAFYIGHADEKISINLSGETQKSDGIRHIDTNGNKDENRFSTLAFNGTYTPNDKLELRLGANTTHTNVIYMGTMTLNEFNTDPSQIGSNQYGSSYHSIQKYNSNVLNIGASYYLNDALSISIDLSNEKKKSEYTLPLYSSTSDSDYSYTLAKTYVEYATKLFALKVGFDGFYADLDYVNSYSVDLDMEKNNQAGFIISEFYLDKLRLKAGYRYEQMKFNESSGDNEKENLHGVELGFNYLLNTNCSFFANYSHAYQTASLDRMFDYFSGGYMGYVKPSESDNYTIGYTYFSKQNKLKISLYYIDLKDEIYYYSDPGYTNSRNTNIDKSHKYGLDIYDKYILNDALNIVANYNYVQAIIDEETENGENYSNKKLPGVSNHNLKLTLNYLPNKNTTLSLTEVYRSDAYAAEDFGNSFSQKQEAYNTTDVAVTYTKDNYEFFAKVNNIFNQKNGIWIHDDAIYPMNYTTTAKAGIKYSF